jgi:hypothetical protein
MLLKLPTRRVALRHVLPTSSGVDSLVRPLPYFAHQPELAPAAAHIDRRTWHVRVSLLIRGNGVAVRQTEQLRDTLSVDKLLGVYFARHFPEDYNR